MSAGTRRPPLPPPLRAWRVLPGLLAGVVGTGLLFQAATGGGLGPLVAGAPLFGLGLAVAGYPFVLATAWRSRARAAARAAGARAPSPEA